MIVIQDLEGSWFHSAKDYFFSKVDLVLGLERLHKNLFFLGGSDSQYRQKIHTTDAGRISLPFFKKNYLSWEYILSLVSEGEKDDGK